MKIKQRKWREPRSCKGVFIQFFAGPPKAATLRPWAGQILAVLEATQRATHEGSKRPSITQMCITHGPDVCPIFLVEEAHFECQSKNTSDIQSDRIRFSVGQRSVVNLLPIDKYLEPQFRARSGVICYSGRRRKMSPVSS